MSSALQLDRSSQSLDDLRADVTRIALDASQAAERAALDGIDAALALINQTCADQESGMRAIARDVLAQAEMLQSEVGRYLDLSRANP